MFSFTRIIKQSLIFIFIILIHYQFQIILQSYIINNNNISSPLAIIPLHSLIIFLASPPIILYSLIVYYYYYYHSLLHYYHSLLTISLLSPETSHVHFDLSSLILHNNQYSASIPIL
jgi:hypothetical protein